MYSPEPDMQWRWCGNACDVVCTPLNLTWRWCGNACDVVCNVQASPEPDMEVEEVEDPILLECVATHGYKGMYEDELSFNSGDRVDVTADSKWLCIYECPNTQN